MIFSLILAAGLSLAVQPGCETCHSEVVQSFSRTGMGQSVGSPASSQAHFQHDLSKSQLTVKAEVHRIQRNGLSAEYPAALRIGSGKVGSSFGVRIAGRWFQSPISWYAQSGEFRISPGYEQEKYPDFDRPIRNECLFCHSSKHADTPVAIGCERCHGDGATHAAKPGRQNIVNPARLSGALRDSVCEQCHLPGVVRVLNPGKTADSYSPGQALEDAWTTYVAGGEFQEASHSEQFAQSACLTAINLKVWCGTCHNPHPTKANPARSVDAVCRDCHQPHDGGRQDCASCHMPKRNVRDVVHTSYTDHRIQRPGSDSFPASPALRAWRAPASHESRNAALALFEWGSGTRNANAIQDAFRQLIDLPPDYAEDAPVLTALGSIALQKGLPKQASDWLGKAVRLDPGNAEAHFRLGRAEQAAKHYEEAIRLDPLFFDAYVLYAQLHRSRGDWQAYERVLQRYLKHVPKSLAARQALSYHSTPRDRSSR